MQASEKHPPSFQKDEVFSPGTGLLSVSPRDEKGCQAWWCPFGSGPENHKFKTILESEG